MFQFVYGFARFIDMVNPLATKRARMKKAAARAAFS
ncbi:hypothetical protein FHR22_002874 [Sphingopyxis panaciterrae]|nr:hypothetical protein [Sphingopyxis panaciterrae]